MSQLDPYFYEKFFDGISPSYVLDDNFNFVAWNRSFEAIFVQQYKITLGSHAAKFVNFMANSKEILERSMKVFGMGNFPKTDTEPLEFRHDELGEFTFYKIASQVKHPDSDELFWLVHLVPYKADNYLKLIEAMSSAIEAGL